MTILNSKFKSGNNRIFGSPGASPDENDTDNAIINFIGVGIAESVYRILQSNNIFVNGSHFVVDEFINSSGTKNTVNVDFETYTFGDPFVEIQATSISTIGDFQINDCNIAPQSGVDNSWILYSHTGTTEEKRAKIHQTLFYGTDGTDARASSTFITGITALKTNISVDVGRRAHYATVSWSSSADDDTYTGVFANTIDNTVDIWGFVNSSTSSSVVGSRLFCPSGNTLMDTVTSTSINEIGTDTTSDRKTNPDNVHFDYGYYSGAGSTQNGIVRVIVLTKDNITWTQTGVFGSPSNIDFLSDNSIPIFTSITSFNYGDAVFNTNKYECKGGIGFYVNSKLIIDSNTKTLDGTEESIVIFGDVINTVNTSVTVDITDGTTTLSDQPLNTVIGLDAFDSGVLNYNYNLNTSDVNDTPLILGYGSYIK